jgi:hypothetical protein
MGWYLEESSIHQTLVLGRFLTILYRGPDCLPRGGEGCEGLPLISRVGRMEFGWPRT